MPGQGSNGHEWWRDAVFYQIYPLSFRDSDGDGFGDLNGIRSKLGYLADTLGVDGVWISPFYRSPMHDWGYDIADHTDVDPIFGTIEEARAMIEEAHELGLKIICDYIPNHTSEQHPWFMESRSSTDNPKRDWYIWRRPKPDGSPPNNWVSVFSGPMWSFDETTGAFYRHTYLPTQPDLNWRTPNLVEEMHDIARFWLDAGVDGFRVDAAHQMMKDPQERDNPPVPPDHKRPWKDMGDYDNHLHLYDYGHPDIHDVYRAFRKVVDSYPGDRLMVGEIHIFDLPEWASYYGEALDEFHMPFNFYLMATEWDAVQLRASIESILWNVPVGGWTNWTLGNHDEVRLASRLGMRDARLAAMLLLTLRGTPFLYYGDEIGMRQVPIPPDKARDPWGFNVPHLSRDGARTPMQWDSSPHAGFTDGTPWLPLSPNYRQSNVETELEDPSSTINLYRSLLRLRKESDALRRGSYLSHPSSNESVLVFRREADHETMTVALNLSAAAASVSIRSGRVRISTLHHDRNDGVNGSLELSPGEGAIVTHD